MSLWALIMWLLIASFLVCSDWLWVTALHSAPSVLSGAPGWTEAGHSWLKLSAMWWEAELAFNQVVRWIPTMWSGSFRSLERLCHVSWHQALTHCHSTLNHRGSISSASVFCHTWLLTYFIKKWNWGIRVCGFVWMKVCLIIEGWYWEILVFKSFAHFQMFLLFYLGITAVMFPVLFVCLTV